MVKRLMKKSTIVLLLAVFMLSIPLSGLAEEVKVPDQEPVAVGDGGAAATEHPAASEAAIKILKKGGNAIDAAVAAAAAQGVTRPFSGGIGGGGFMHIYLADEDRSLILDHVAVTSENMEPDAYINPETGTLYPSNVRRSSGVSVGIPGSVKAWEEALEKYGTMTLSEVLQPAIEVAEEGFVADDNFIRETSEEADRLRLFDSSIDVYLEENGDVPEPGTVMKNPDLAKTYRLIAEHGSDIFYEGEIAEAIIETIQNPPVVDEPAHEVLPGKMSMDDLRNYETLTREPTHINYRGYDILSAPPSSSGITISQILNILEPYDLGDMSKKQALHYYLEASRYAFADRIEYLGDPFKKDIPMEGLLSKGYAEERRQHIKDDRASVGRIAHGNPWPYEEDPDKRPDPSPEDPIFYHDFTGNDGDTWDSNAFYYQHSFPNAPLPDGATFRLQDNTGQVVLDKREQGNGSAYGRTMPNMEALEDTDMLVRFRFDELGKDQRMRLWIQADTFPSGSTMPVNGYGIQLSASTKKLILYSRKNSSSINLGSIDTDLTTDWHWLRLRSHGDELSVRLWDGDKDHEPEEWDIVHHLSESEQIDNDLGRALLSFINFNYDTGNTISLDEVTIKDASDLPEEPREGSFTYHFDGNVGDSWDQTKIHTVDEGITFDLSDDGGRMTFNQPPGNYSTSYGKATPVMKDIGNGELVMRFRTDDPGIDRRLRLWMRADNWRTNRSTFADNGYGIEVNTKNNHLILKSMEDGTQSDLGTIEHTWDDEWMWLKLHLDGDQLKVRLWEDSEDEPDEWGIEVTDDRLTGAGKTLIGIHDLEPTGEGNFHISDITINDLDAQESNVVQDITIESLEGEEEEEDSTETIHFSVSDRDGNIVSYTSTINSIGGNAMVVPGYGFLLNNGFSGRTYEPGQRYNSAMSPTIVTKDGKPVMTIGSPSSGRIITTNTQIIINYLDLGMTLPEAIEEPRLSQRNLLSGSAQYEGIYLDEYGTLLDELGDMGHLFTADNAVQGISAAEGIEFLPDGRMRAAAEPTRRGGGSAMALDLDDIEEPPGEASISAMLDLIDQYKDEGEIKTPEVARLLQTHLTAVGHYEQRELMDKAIKHMENFKLLLDHQQDNEMISEEATSTLQEYADDLIDQWK